MKSIHLYPTLRCNGRCVYCSNQYPWMKNCHEFQEVAAGYWVDLLKEIPKDWQAVITGGEFLMYDGAAAIVKSLPSRAWIYTNLSVLTDGVVGAADPEKVVFRCSFHPKVSKVDWFLECLKTLAKREIPVQVYMVDVPENEALRYRSDVFRPQGYEIGIDHDQRRYEHRVGKVRCRHSTMIVGPDRKSYPCVSKMLRGKDGKEVDLSESITEVECDESALCSPCDLAAACQEGM